MNLDEIRERLESIGEFESTTSTLYHTYTTDVSWLIARVEALERENERLNLKLDHYSEALVDTTRRIAERKR